MDQALNPNVSASATQEASAQPQEVKADAPVSPDVDRTGRVLGEFKLLRLIGQGGMGQVYLAEQLSLKRHVALKLLKPELAASEKSLQRFKAEAEAVARATHANIVQVYAIGAAEGVHFMALEYVEGRTLREYLEKKGTPDLLLGLSVMRQVASALQRANELGIIHRDIKPENILLTRKGEVKVTDFGLFRAFGENVRPTNLTGTNVTMGTPLYMSPEQVEGKRDLDHRTDIYSFGVTCYHMFAGHPPFRGTSPFEVAVQHVQKEPQPLAEIRPDLPADLCNIIHKMMAKAPENRYQTAREVVRDVSRLRDVLVGASTFLGNSGVTVAAAAALSDATEALATQEMPRSGRGRWSRRLVFLTLLLLACGGGVYGGWLLNQHATPPGPGPGPIDEPSPAVKAAILQKEREKELIRLVQEHTKPGNIEKLDEAVGLKFSIQLGLLYLEERRLKEAEAFFKELEEKTPQSYRFLGRVGKAMVLAFRDQPEESNKQFKQLLFPGKISPKDKLLKKDKTDRPLTLFPVTLRYPPLMEMVARALNHNYLNDPRAFPEELEPFRHPPAPTLRTPPLPTAGP